MPSSADLKRRIKSVKSTQKITKAMKLVSAAKFAKAVTAVKSSRPYHVAFSAMMSRLMNDAEGVDSQFLRETAESKILLIVMSTDRGLCGGLNGNLFRYAGNWIRDKKSANVDVKASAWGRRSLSFLVGSGHEVVSQYEKVFEKPDFLSTKRMLQPITDAFIEGKYDAVYLAFPEFQSAIAQTPTVQKIFPVSTEAEDAAQSPELTPTMKVEPGIAQMFDRLIERKIIGQVLAARLEGQASEHGARMSAMDSATRNADDVIKKLTLQYNRARQAAITKELIEIVSGAEAL